MKNMTQLIQGLFPGAFSSKYVICRHPVHCCSVSVLCAKVFLESPCTLQQQAKYAQWTLTSFQLLLVLLLQVLLLQLELLRVPLLLI